MTAVDGLALRQFGSVEDARDPQLLLAALDEQSSFPAVQRLRATATDLLAPRIGSRLVDVGCGLGDVAMSLAGIVGAEGHVVGIDANETMLAEARRRAADRSLSVDFRSGDATSLELDDAAFDGAVSERVFQHLSRPDVALAEMVRVTKPGGRIVVVDTDWGMHAVHGADPRLTARIVDSWAQSAVNPWSGRRLPALFAAAGMPEPVVVAETFTTTDPRRVARPPIANMAAVAAGTRAVGADDADAWLAQLADAATRGELFWAVTMFAVGSVRP
jgi:ubiquinone/menaquinone biosynthesis C-methylase UbiE